MVHCLKWKRTWSQYFETDGRPVRDLLHSATIVLEEPMRALRERACLLSEEWGHAETPQQALTGPALASEAMETCNLSCAVGLCAGEQQGQGPLWRGMCARSWGSHARGATYWPGGCPTIPKKGKQSTSTAQVTRQGHGGEAGLRSSWEAKSVGQDQWRHPARPKCGCNRDHLSALASEITRIHNKRLQTRCSPPLTHTGREANMTKRNASLGSCGTYFTLVNTPRCRFQDQNWILCTFRWIWGLKSFHE